MPKKFVHTDHRKVFAGSVCGLNHIWTTVSVCKRIFILHLTLQLFFLVFSLNICCKISSMTRHSLPTQEKDPDISTEFKLLSFCESLSLRIFGSSWCFMRLVLSVSSVRLILWPWAFMWSIFIFKHKFSSYRCYFLCCFRSSWRIMLRF